MTFSSFKFLQAQERDLGCVLEEGGPVLLLPFLDPVSVNTESAAIDEFADAAVGVWIPGQDVTGQRARPAVTAIHPNAG